ncbi:hypothetical protein AN963_00725 [Brevibacillus choshinensis]|uniref:Uncharacterized protein n=1 Tax=Brevibacillus choshinensis TaxID=54911 RepID=A0ABR5NA35_BRECH|nr:hypothetical protein AN963_00725 [Brevibacillus choshinensis]
MKLKRFPLFPFLHHSQTECKKEAGVFPAYFLCLGHDKGKHIEKNRRGKSSKYLFFSKTH